MKLITVLRWVARILSLVLAVFLILICFMVGSGGKQTSGIDLVGLVFMVCLIAGLILSWPKELPGIVLSYTGLAGMWILLMYIHEKDLHNLAYVAIPTTILVICRIAERGKTK